MPVSPAGQNETSNFLNKILGVGNNSKYKGFYNVQNNSMSQPSSHRAKKRSKSPALQSYKD
jgi:hypothetical protein